MIEINLIFIGILVILIGFIITIIGTFLQAKGKAEIGFIGFIGPFPIGFGTSEKILFITIILSLIILLVIFLFQILKWFL